MDQLHGAHDNGRAANAPAQTRDFTEHRTAQINHRKNTAGAVGDKGQGNVGPTAFETMLQQSEPEGPSALLAPKVGRKQ
jgi:hypothetical protein